MSRSTGMLQTEASECINQRQEGKGPRQLVSNFFVGIGVGPGLAAASALQRVT